MCRNFHRIKKQSHPLVSLSKPDFCVDFEYTIRFPESHFISEIHATINSSSLFSPKSESWRERNPTPGVKQSKKCNFYFLNPEMNLYAEFQLPNYHNPREINSPSLFSQKMGVGEREIRSPGGASQNLISYLNPAP